MTTENNRYEQNKVISSKYMTNTKKKYYLASVDASVSTLLENQKDQLTRVLIELKSEYDKITRDTAIKNQKTNELDQQISLLQLIEAKKKKAYNQIVSIRDSINNSVAVKKEKKLDEQYEVKIHTKQIEKLKLDIILIQKMINDKQNELEKLKKIYQKEKLNENDIIERKNQVYLKVNNQNNKNKMDKNDQSQKLEYYKIIIAQKNEFIRGEDDRKMKQMIIAQQAKNYSQDKKELEDRRKLQFIKLYNQYLREKMNDLLQANEEIEKSFTKIRDICGTANLEEIVDVILYKEKRYNHTAAVVEQKETIRNVLKADIAVLEKMFVGLKNESKFIIVIIIIGRFN